MSGETRLGLSSVAASVSAVLVLLVLVFAPNAAAATEFGSTCQSSLSRLNNPSGLQLSRVAGALETTAPGVVTKWKVNAGSSSSGFESLRVYKQVGAVWETIAGSTGSSAYASGKLNEFPVRIPVPAGVAFGVASPEKKLAFCPGASGDTIGFFAADAEVGASTPALFDEEEAILALAVVVEPDVDGDDYGDETQDACPQNPNLHTPCPLTVTPPTAAPPAGNLALGLKAKLEGDVVAVQVTGSAAATVAVSDTFRGHAVAGPKSANVAPGRVGRAYLPLSKSLKRKVAQLPRRQHLNLVIEASGQSAAGARGSAELEFAVPGRKKPSQHKHHHH